MKFPSAKDANNKKRKERTMKKTKLFSIILAVVMVVSAICVLAACNNGPAIDDTELKEIVSKGQKMTTEQLLAEAKKENGDFVAYGNTSRITTAMDNFIKEYGAELGISGNKASKLSDAEIYKKLDTEAKATNKSANASIVLIQDSATLNSYRATTKMLTNYVPMGMEKNVDEENLVPLAHQFINKLFMYNVSDKNNTLKFTNVWQLTDAKYKGNIYFKDPTSEQVNMNFLVMLTNKDWSDKLEKAYKALNNKAAEDVGEGKTYKTYGHKWIAEFLNNCNFSINSDTTIAQKLSTTDNKGKMGLFVLSKLRDSSVYGDNLQVSAWDKDGDNYQTIDPFAGFMYSIYAQLATNGPRPYTAMLFINYLMTKEGFKPWESMGGYSANKEVPVYDGSLTKPVELTAEQAAVGGADGKSKDGFVYTDNNGALLKYVKSEKKDIGDKKDVSIKYYMYLDGANAGTIVTDINPETGKANKITVGEEQKDFKASVKTSVVKEIKDSPLSFWRNVLVIEDGAYIRQAKADGVVDWINQQLTGKVSK